MTTRASEDRAREAFERSAWVEACKQWEEAGRGQVLAPADLSDWATAAYLVGRDEEADDLRARAHRGYLAREDADGAARCAFWLGLGLLLRGEPARGGAWLGRAHRDLKGVEAETVATGYLYVPSGLHAMGVGDFAAAYTDFGRAIEQAERFDDPDLMALGHLGQGQTAVKAGEASRGLALLDECMVSITAGEVGAVVAGIVFCAVIEACHETFDLRRAQEWTDAMTRWCATQPDLVPYRGQCAIYRAEVLRARGDWETALDEALEACQRLAVPPHPALGLAQYELGELRRLRGEPEAAETAFRQANLSGFSPQPGLSQLDLARGRVGAARVALAHSLDEATRPLDRARLLGPAVDAELAAHDVLAARDKAEELLRIADQVDATALHGAAGHAHGAVQLAEGDALAAARTLRGTAELWRELDAPYEAARARVLLAVSCRHLGDWRTAELELEAACSTFVRLGARADLAAAHALTPGEGGSKSATGLSGRELEVLRLVATGRSNREIAAALTLSEHTVRRHLQNIFGKLGLPSRAAATAYAFRHHLV